MVFIRQSKQRTLNRRLAATKEAPVLRQSDILARCCWRKRNEGDDLGLYVRAAESRMSDKVIWLLRTPRLTG